MADKCGCGGGGGWWWIGLFRSNRRPAPSGVRSADYLHNYLPTYLPLMHRWSSLRSSPAGLTSSEGGWEGNLVDGWMEGGSENGIRLRLLSLSLSLSPSFVPLTKERRTNEMHATDDKAFFSLPFFAKIKIKQPTKERRCFITQYKVQLNTHSFTHYSSCLFEGLRLDLPASERVIRHKKSQTTRHSESAWRRKWTQLRS